MRLIDADSLKIPSEEIIAKMTIELAQTIDAVPVVRCRDCECWYPEEDNEYGHCRKHDFWSSETWFCADGERREDEG